MKRIAALFSLLAFVTLIGMQFAEAQSSYDPKSQPGSGQCRLSNGQRC